MVASLKPACTEENIYTLKGKQNDSNKLTSSSARLIA